MVDPRSLRRWLYRAGFFVLASFIVFLYLLPLRVGAGYWPGPDLLLCFAFTWVMRRPDYVPAWLVALIMVMADFLFLRPPGLWAALTLGGLEFLRRREAQSHELPFVGEWAMVAGVMLAMALCYRLVLAVFMVDQATLGLTILAQISTILAYPLVVLLSTTLFGVHRVSAAEADAMRYV